VFFPVNKKLQKEKMKELLKWFEELEKECISSSFQDTVRRILTRFLKKQSKLSEPWIEMKTPDAHFTLEIETKEHCDWIIDQVKQLKKTLPKTQLKGIDKPTK